MIIRHDKLVRDRIPEIIRESSKSCVTRVLDEKEGLAALEAKLQEELNEYLASGDMEELADLLEVMMACSRLRGHSFAEVEILRHVKHEKRGGFNSRIFLETVTAPDP